MKFEEFKKHFYKSGTDKKFLLNKLKIYYPEFSKLQKNTLRLEKEFTSLKGLLNNVILGDHYLPQSYFSLNKTKKNLFSNSLECEMNWQVLAFLKCSKLINTFNDLRNEFEHYLLIGNYQDARITLDKVEKEICISFWSIENRFILDEYQYSSEKNWETRNIVIDEKNDAYVRVLGNMYSVKTEKRVPFFQYNDEFNNWQELEGLNEGQELEYLIEYFRFKGNYFSHDQYTSFTKILYLESNSSIIDRYLIFIRVSQHLVSKRNTNVDFVITLLKILSIEINDIFINQLLLAKCEYNLKNSTPNCEIINAIDEYTIGNYSRCQSSCKDLLVKKYGDYIELVEIYIKSLIESNNPYQAITEEDSLLNQIGKNYFDVLNKNDNTNNALLELVKLSYVFNNSHIGLKIYSFIKQELGWETEIDYAFISRLSSKFINPKLWESLYENKNESDYFTANLSSIYSNSITAKLFNNFNKIYSSVSNNSQLILLPNFKDKLYQNRNLLLKKDFDSAIDSYSKLLSEDKLSIISKYEIISNLYLCYLEKKDYRNCLIIYVNIFIKNAHLTKKCNTINILKDIIKGKFKNIGIKSDLIELPIFFKINSIEKIRVKQAYEQFLIANGCSKPSELNNSKQNFNREKLIYFLRNVCIPEIMQLSKYLSSTQKVNEERIAICQFLAGFDTENIDVYNNEIAATTQKNIISKVIGGIDERKIYVNDERIKSFLLKTEKPSAVSKDHSISISKDSFERYISLINFVKENEYKDVNGILRFEENGEATFIEAEKDEVFKRDDYDMILYMPVFRLFKDFFLSIRDLFVFNNEYGLDAYLSSKIRHGTLPNHLRSVFENYHLVTSQTDGIYLYNKYWEEKLNISAEKNIKIQELLSVFSKKVDEISKVLKEEWIQCRTEKKLSNPNALFDFSYEKTELIILIIQEFSSIKDYEIFIEKALTELWNRTEICLLNIRKKIDTDLKLRFNEIIYELENNLLEIVDRNEVYELVNNINICRTEIQTKLGNIANWFRRSESSFYGKYDLQTLIETSIQIIKNINPIYNFEIEKNICVEVSIKGEYHQHFIDVMNNFLQNMIEHSKVPVDLLNANLSLVEIDGALEVRFGNSVSEKVDINELLGKLTKVKNNWEKFDNNVSKDKNSGFPKIKKILRSDLGRKASNFNYSLNDKYLIISISFEREGLIYENINN